MAVLNMAHGATRHVSGLALSTPMVQLGKRLGEGAYGKVYALVDPRTGEHSARKIGLADKHVSFFANIAECDKMSLIPRSPAHPYIIGLKRFSNGKEINIGRALSPMKRNEYKSDTLCIDMEEGFSDLSLFVDTPYASMPQLKNMVIHMLLGLEFLHTNGMAHRDLKPANCVIVRSTAPSGESGYVLKLGDLAMAKFASWQDTPTREIGSLIYRAPEVIEGSYHTTAMDIWAVGCIIFQMFTKKMLFEYNSNREEPNVFLTLHRKCVEERRVRSEMKLSDKDLKEFNESSGPKWSEMVDLVEKCINLDPAKRPTVTEILDFPMFAAYAPHIAELRKYFPYTKTLAALEISQSPIRLALLARLKSVYGVINRFTWFRMRIMFMTADLLDRYLWWLQKNGTNIFERDGLFVMAVCLYLSINYHVHTGFDTCFGDVCRWVMPQPVHNVEATGLKTAEFLLSGVAAPGNICRPTVLEAADYKGHALNAAQAYCLLDYYCGRSDYHGKNVREVYEDWFSSFSAPTSNTSESPNPTAKSTSAGASVDSKTSANV